MLHYRLQTRNIFKLIVVYTRLQQISYCHRWIHVVLVTERIRCNHPPPPPPPNVPRWGHKFARTSDG